jgi:AcrR family transcriptional regulator
MAETRRRIALATLDLHATVGPARTTVSAIAERAGVERATVYRHFPDELSLFRACVGHGLQLYPGPDPSLWAAIEDPEERLRTGLGELYRFYRRNESLWFNVHRDLPDLPAMWRANQELGVFDYFAALRDALFRGRNVRGRRAELVRAALGHAIDFRTWHSLVRVHGLDDEGAIDAMAAMIRCLAPSGRVRSGTGSGPRDPSGRSA